MASSRILELILKVSVNANDQLRHLQADLQALAGVQLGGVSQGVQGVGDAADKAATDTDGLRKAIFGVGGGAGALAAISTGFGAISSAIQTAIGLAGQFYGSTIGAAEALNAQLLSSQTNLASASRIFKGGIEITDPTEKIQATRGALEKAIATIEVETETLVGVTSEQVNQLFQITLQNAGILSDQARGMVDGAGKDISEQFNNPIEAATKLTKGWAASLKVIGVPLDQAGQEINSILKGQIDGNSILAKSLNLNSAQVAQWRSQGTLVTELNKKLETFVAGNAIAANTIEGASSNILDAVQRYARELGKPLLQPVTDALNSVFATIKANEPIIKAVINGVGTALGSVIGAGLQGAALVFQAALTGVLNVANMLAPVFQTVGSVVGGAFNAIMAVLNPVIQGIGALINSPFGQFLTQVIATGAAIAAVAAAVVFLGPVVAGIGAAFMGLVGAVGAAIAAFAPLAAVVTGVMAVVGSVVMGAVAVFQQFYQAAAQGLAPAFEAIGKFGAVLQIIGGVILSVIGNQAMGILRAFGALAQSVFNGLMGVMAPVGSFIKDVFLGYFSLIGEAISGLVNKVTETLTAIVSNPAFQAIAKTIGVDVDQLKQSLADLGKKGEDAGQKVGEGAKAGSEGLRIAGQEAQKLGTSYEQLAEKAANAQRGLDSAQTTDEAKKAAAELVQITQQQMELGQISEAEAQKRLSAIASNAAVEVETQQQAQQALTQIRETGNKAESAQLEQQTRDVESQIKRREVTEVEGAKRIAALKQQQLQQQLEASKQAIAAEEAAIAGGTGSQTRLAELQRQQADLQRQAGDQSRAGTEAIAKAETDTKKRELDTQKANIDAQLAQIAAARAQGTITTEQAAIQETALKKQQLDIQLQDIQAQIAQAQAANDPTKVAQLQAQAEKIKADQVKQGADAQKAIFDAKLRDFEDKERRATDTIKTAEAERTAEIDKQVAAGTMTREQAEDAKLKMTQQRIQQELQAERAKLTAIQAIEATSPGAQKDKDAQVLASRQKIAQLTSQAAQSEIQQQEKLKQAAESAQQKQKENAQKAAEAAAKPFENQLKLIDVVNKALENQGKLLQANQQLFQAGADLMKSQYDIAADFAESEGDTEKAKQIRLEQAQAELEAQRMNQEFERMSLEFEQQKARIMIEQAKIQLKIKMLKAETPEEKALLQEEGKLLDQQAAQQEDIFERQKQAQETKFQQQDLQGRAKIAKLTDGTEDDQAIANEALAGARNTRNQLMNGGFGAPQEFGFQAATSFGSEAAKSLGAALGVDVKQGGKAAPGKQQAKSGADQERLAKQQMETAPQWLKNADAEMKSLGADLTKNSGNSVVDRVIQEGQQYLAETKAAAFGKGKAKLGDGRQSNITSPDGFVPMGSNPVVSPTPQNPSGQTGQPGQPGQAVPAMATLAPQVSFNLFVEGKDGKIPTQSIQKSLMETVSGVIKEAAKAK